MTPSRLPLRPASSLFSKVIASSPCRNLAYWAKSTGVLAAGAVILGAITMGWPYVFPSEHANLPSNLQLTRIYLDKQPKDTLGNFYFMLGTQMAARGQILVAEDLLAKAIKIQPEQAD